MSLGLLTYSAFFRALQACPLETPVRFCKISTNSLLVACLSSLSTFVSRAITSSSASFRCDEMRGERRATQGNRLAISNSCRCPLLFHSARHPPLSLPPVYGFREYSRAISVPCAGRSCGQTTQYAPPSLICPASLSGACASVRFHPRFQRTGNLQGICFILDGCHALRWLPGLAASLGRLGY